MIYRLKILPSAQRELAALPTKIQRQVDKRIRALATNPRPHGSIKLSGEKDLYRIQSGDYRIIYEIRDDVLLVTVVRVRHRKDVYRF
ncbi:MAG: addiction module toxin RelE [Candidatus Handelsmanbacteria bacterium RIFCSPLOWO2_12_FULL_64_10]|uniref:Addiction module toxin RelE n=1 Tax=Handelsmanbacteria sp. (strain RIFCSPLOWO2_12_FULL_64_10) TaxID=1817868 RepID=A0A1F6C9M5_HANXR|nr:MAG: addiction module toxin RelE [Candidatus Handelsmanbacteria bacterium RIFCSPLOWO2_12_FULL_64_10]